MHAQGNTYSPAQCKSEHGYMVHLCWQSCYTIPVHLKNTSQWSRITNNSSLLISALKSFNNFHLNYCGFFFFLASRNRCPSLHCTHRLSVFLRFICSTLPPHTSEGTDDMLWCKDLPAFTVNDSLTWFSQFCKWKFCDCSKVWHALVSEGNGIYFLKPSFVLLITLFSLKLVTKRKELVFTKSVISFLY